MTSSLKRITEESFKLAKGHSAFVVYKCNITWLYFYMTTFDHSGRDSFGWSVSEECPERYSRHFCDSDKSYFSFKIEPTLKYTSLPGMAYDWEDITD